VVVSTKTLLIHCPVFREQAKFVSSVSSFPSPRVGDTIEVLYNPSDPDEAIIDRFMFRHLFEVVVFSFGVVGVFVYVYQRYAAGNLG
jgi:hypothetical protein